MRAIRAGVPQGSTLSPLLLSAYVNDIPRPSTSVQLALFADDTALYLKSNSIGNILPRVQRAIDKLTQWLRLWRIDVNPEKPVMTYASPVFAHVPPDILYDLQIVQNKFCRRAADAPCFGPYHTSHLHHITFAEDHGASLLDPPDDLTVKVEKLIEVNKMAIDWE
ncbi:Probable RNA-directed DNA polymerase from transposon BS [Eumeta japonica]|uniref:Probable RNA-directed DNA polymerase from transposon BS n=1 Tax=Eumeta variegata TaxID=151549 RepID=A0A4C1XTX5_EUMVA|nr:Probable RNA-directed DNA polymerase from transposon BS [Eumeta japonica]